MINLIKHDFYRVRKSVLLYSMVALIIVSALFLTVIIRLDGRLAIGMGNTFLEFREISDVIRNAVMYQHGLGIIVAILIAIFIGQEYQWKTWQQKWLATKNRTKIYLSKLVLSITLSVAMFLIFQFIPLVFGGQGLALLTLDYGAIILGGIAIYATVGAVFSTFAMLSKNITIAVIACLGYVFLAESVYFGLASLVRFSEFLTRIVEWLIRHTSYGMTMRVFAGYNVMIIIINALVITFLTTAVGLTIFRKYDL